MAGCDKNTRFTCDWLDSILVVLSDGKVVCGCADPNGKRPLGHLKDNTLYEIWNSEKVKKIRRDLNAGHACFCHDCGLKRPLRDDEEIPQHPEYQEVLSRIFFEPTVACNINCFEAVCNFENGIIKTRTRKRYPMDEFKEVIDQVGEKLTRLDLFNYGDPFVHPEAPEMVKYIKEKYPHIYVYISTNGLLLTDDKIKTLVASGMDEITFSVDGPDQETYEKYRRGGDFNKVFNIMKKFVIERNQVGREVPFINWRYIIFKWNDSKAHMKKAKKLAEQIGVDRFIWEITDHPEAAKSEKYQPGTEHWKKIYHEIWDTSQIGNAIKSKRFTARMKVLNKPGEIKAGSEPVDVKVKVKNVGGALWRKATTSGRRWVRIGAQLHDRNRNMIDLNYARAFLNRDLANREKDVLTISLPSVPEPGDYYLKFDMVSEGNDWFENGGSPVVWEPFRVQQA